MLDPESSRRLDLLRFPLIVAIVFVHAYETNVGLAGQVAGISDNGAFSDFVRNVTSQGLARTAVPLFFLMSGYFFFLGFGGGAAAYFAKLKSRVRTLLLPFLFWNFATLAVFAAAQAVPEAQAYFSGKNIPVAEFGFYDYANAIFGIDKYPISYQFWFIRDLMVLILLAPVIAALCRFLPLPYLGAVFALWFANVWPVLSPSPEATLFFSIGVAAAVHGKSLFALDPYGKALILAYIPIVTVDAAFFGAPNEEYFHRVGVAVGVAAVLSATRRLVAVQGLPERLEVLNHASFFIYAAHEPLLTIVRKLSFKALMPTSSMLILLLYFLVPTLVIAALIVLRKGLVRVMPGFLAVVTGGR